MLGLLESLHIAMVCLSPQSLALQDSREGLVHLLWQEKAVIDSQNLMEWIIFVLLSTHRTFPSVSLPLVATEIQYNRCSVGAQMYP